MNAHPQTLGWLNRALSHELSAVQQYQAQSVLAKMWGETSLASYLKQEAVGELIHAERLMERLIMLGVAPNASALAPARLGRTVDELLLANRQLELDAVHIYQQAVLHANRVRDVGFASLMNSILDEERDHLTELDRMILGRKNHV
jgi:bacterioferritin